MGQFVPQPLPLGCGLAVVALLYQMLLGPSYGSTFLRILVTTSSPWLQLHCHSLLL